MQVWQTNKHMDHAMGSSVTIGNVIAFSAMPPKTEVPYQYYWYMASFNFAFCLENQSLQRQAELYMINWLIECSINRPFCASSYDTNAESTVK